MFTKCIVHMSFIVCYVYAVHSAVVKLHVVCCNTWFMEYSTYICLVYLHGVCVCIYVQCSGWIVCMLLMHCVHVCRVLCMDVKS